MSNSFKLLIAIAAVLPLSACSQSERAPSLPMQAMQDAPAIQSDTTARLDDPRTTSVVSLYKFNGEDIAFACTGVAISKNLVLTAGHCIRVGENHDQRMPKDSMILAHFGQKFDFNKDLAALENKDAFTGEGPMRAAGIDQVKVHPKYKGGNYCQPGVVKYDIALLRLNSDIPSFAKGIKPLESTKAIRKGLATTLFGFGPTDSDAAANTVIVRTMSTVIDSLINSENRVVVQLDRNFTIAGDSGGPAFIEQSGAPAVMGILSCSGDANGRGIYESVPNHMDWIKSAAAELEVPLE